MLLWIKKILGLLKHDHKETNSSKKAFIKGASDNKEDLIDMKYLIVGLGNMEAAYNNTRHNVGFNAVDALVEETNKSYEVVKYGLKSEVKHKGRTLIIIKPNTYMNLSGKAVKYWMDKLNIKRENLLIVTDDLHTDFETIRLRAKGSAAGHNGLKDIEQRIGGSNYNRLKIGIGSTFGQGKQVDYVLGKWTRKEQDLLPEIMDRAIATIKDYVSIGIARAMTIHNRKASKA